MIVTVTIRYYRLGEISMSKITNSLIVAKHILLGVTQCLTCTFSALVFSLATANKIRLIEYIEIAYTI